MKKGQLFSLLIGLTFFSAQADIVVYTSGTGTAGLMSDYTQAFTVRDVSLDQSDANTAYGGGNDVQAVGTFFADETPGYALLSLENLFSSDHGQYIASGEDITTANLWVYQSGIELSGTLTIRGLSTNASEWVESSATWNNPDNTGMGWDGAGGTIDSVLSGTYGTAAFSITNQNNWVKFDVTDALKAYKDGEISGLLLTTADDGGVLGIPSFSFDSADNPSGNSLVLEIDQTIPEPAAVSLIMIGGSFFYGVRRHRSHRKNNEPEFE